MTDSTSKPDKLPLTSADLTETLMAQLREAAPQVFSEGKVDFAKLQSLLNGHIDNDPERYGLTWAGKRSLILRCASVRGNGQFPDFLPRRAHCTQGAQQEVNRYIGIACFH